MCRSYFPGGGFVNPGGRNAITLTAPRGPGSETRDHHPKPDEGATGAGVDAAAGGGPHVPLGIAEMPATHHPQGIFLEIVTVIGGVDRPPVLAPVGEDSHLYHRLQ